MDKISSSNIKKIASIGCGVSNLSFLYSLPVNEKIYIDLFEKERKISGRASTRSKDGYTYDLGANYISSSHPMIPELLSNKLNSQDLITIDKWTYPFDKNNKISFEHTDETKQHNRLTKYNYKTGINTISNLLLSESKSNFKINFSTQITKISSMENSKWELFSSDNKSLGIYDYVVFGIPVPQILNILKNSEFNCISNEDKNFLSKNLLEELNNIEYKSIYSLAVAFEPKIEFENDFYALINSDRENEISWISVENEKRGRISEDKKNSVMFIVQMSEKFSMECSNSNMSKDEINLRIVEKVKLLLPQLNKEDVKVSFMDSKLWKYALPKNRINEEIIQKLHKNNVFIIGDSLIGKGRVDGAILTGFELCEYFRKNNLI